MGAYNMNLCESELIEIVRAFRSSNTNIVKLWNTVEKAFIEAVNNKSIVHIDKNISFIYEGNILFIKLPSGRRLSYIRPRIDYNNAFNKSVITYEGVDSTTKKNTRLTTYGGKLVENIVQAIARDVLGEAMINLRNKGFNIVMHVHDEIVLEVEKGSEIGLFYSNNGFVVNHYSYNAISLNGENAEKYDIFSYSQPLTKEEYSYFWNIINEPEYQF